MIRTGISVLFSLSLFGACTGGSGDGSSDASILPAADADSNAPDADPSAPDASAGGSDIDAGLSLPDAGANAGIVCGMDTCTLGSEECCITGFSSFACVAEGSCDGTPAACDGPEDCSGDICCGNMGGMSCTDTCEGNAVELCHTPADCTTAGDMCCEFGPLSVCAPSCNGGGGGGFPQNP